MGEVAIGSGIGKYIEALNGQNADAAFTAADDLEALSSSAGVLGYERHWTPTLQSTIAYAVANLEESALLSPSTIEQTQDGRANLIWAPDPKVDIGGEVLYGRRENQDGASGEAWRFQFSMIYKIN